MKRAAAIASLALISALVLSGCSSSSGSSESAPAPAIGGNHSSGGSQSESSVDGVAPQDGVESLSAEKIDDTLITTGWITMSVTDPLKASDEAISLTSKFNGRIDARGQDFATELGEPRSSLTIRIPSDDLDAFLDELENLGTLTQVSISSVEVGTQVTDLDSRISALAASLNRLEGLVAQAATVDDLIRLESEISTRQGEHDSLVAQRDALGDQIAYSTVELSMFTPAATPETPGPKDFFSGVVTGWDALVVTLGSLLIAFGVLLPWLIFPAIALLVVFLMVRNSRRKKVEAGAQVEPNPDRPAPFVEDHEPGNR